MAMALQQLGKIKQTCHAVAHRTGNFLQINTVFKKTLWRLSFSMMALDYHSHDPLIRKWNDHAVTEIFQSTLHRHSVLCYGSTLWGKWKLRKQKQNLLWSKTTSLHLTEVNLFMYIVEKVKEVKCFISWTDWQAEGIDETVSKWEVQFSVHALEHRFTVSVKNLCKFLNIYIRNLWDIKYQNLDFQMIF